jgi:hypothetical protein
MTIMEFSDLDAWTFSGRKLLGLATLFAVGITLSDLDPAEAQERVVLKDLAAELADIRQVQAQLALRADNLERQLRELYSDSDAPVAAVPIVFAEENASNEALPAEGQTLVERLRVTGDFRLRYEHNSGGGLPERNRGVFRGRLRSSFQIDHALALSAELVTGDRDDPNTADVTISEYFDDIDIGLSQIYLEANVGNARLFAGKFPNLFVSSELVWDGDVNPQGIGAVYVLGGHADHDLIGRLGYFLIDEEAAGSDSTMLGGQFELKSRISSEWESDIAFAYYDYSLGTVLHADSGDFRSNLRRPDGNYLSDFNLINATGRLVWSGLDVRWPLGVSADYVKNLGSASEKDSGFGLRLFAGNTLKPGDFSLSYGYSQVGVDAVLAAFSNDNLVLATNYQSHDIGTQLAITDTLSLGASWHVYKSLDDAALNQPFIGDWANRFRVNFVVQF